jgi:hypothetical protein
VGCLKPFCCPCCSFSFAMIHILNLKFTGLTQNLVLS